MNYNVVSSDDHRPGNRRYWTKRVPAKLRDRVPRLRRTDDGDIWFIDGKPAGTCH